MAPSSFADFFIAVAGASGALIGLLFVAISVARAREDAGEARAASEIRETSALTALATPLTLSLVGLIPGASLGVTAIIIGTGGVIFVVSSIRRTAGRGVERRSRWRTWTALYGFLVIMGFDLGYGIDIVAGGAVEPATSAIAGAMIGSLGLGIARSWEFVGGRRYGVSSAVADILRPQDDRPNA